MKTVLSVAISALLLALVGISTHGQQVKDPEVVFAELDQNKDGKLTQAEFERLFEMEGVTNASPKDKQNEFEAWDADGDGVISKAEFVAKYPLRLA